MVTTDDVLAIPSNWFVSDDGDSILVLDLDSPTPQPLRIHGPASRLVLRFLSPASVEQVLGEVATDDEGLRSDLREAILLLLQAGVILPVNN